MHPARRLLLAGLGVAAAEAVLGTLALPTGLAPYLFACAAATVAKGKDAGTPLVEPWRGGAPVVSWAGEIHLESNALL